MVVDSEQFARNAEADTRNDPGYCLQQTRIWAEIDSKYPDATTAWKNANNKHPGDRHPPRGVAVYWTGGSKGYGHIACSLGGGKIRTTDGDGNGNVATRDLDWVQQHWGLPYAGWANNINEVTIPAADKEDDMANYSDWPDKDKKALANDVVDALLTRDLYADDKQKDVSVGRALRVAENAGNKILDEK
jgi:hypothetical protein